MLVLTKRLEKGSALTAIEHDANLNSIEAEFTTLLKKGGYSGTAKDLNDQIQIIKTILDSDDANLDELQEIVSFIKQNKEDLQNLSIANIAGLVQALDLKLDRSEYANQIQDYRTETLSEDMGDVFRFYNGNIWKYVGLRPFDTNDMEQEILQGFWTAKIATYPAVEFATITPRSIQPNTTRWVQVDASNIVQGTTMDFGVGINVLDYSYVSSSRMLVQIQAVGALGYVTMPFIDNGTNVEIQQDFSISLGELYVPDSIDTHWTNTNSNLIYTIGGVENILASFYFSGTFGSGIPIESDCSLSFSLEDVTGGMHLYFGFGNQPSNSFITNANFRSYSSGNLYGQNSASGSHSMDQPLAGSSITLKRIKQTANTCNIEVYQNSVLQDTFYSISVTEVWFPLFRLMEVVKIKNIELLIL